MHICVIIGASLETEDKKKKKKKKEEQGMVVWPYTCNCMFSAGN